MEGWIRRRSATEVPEMKLIGDRKSSSGKNKLDTSTVVYNPREHA